MDHIIHHLKSLQLQVVYRLIVLLLLLFLMSGSLQASLVPDPKERVEYWRSNYTELSDTSDKRVAQAQQIFERILNAAGGPHGVHPRLLIIKEDPLNISLPVSIPDGWVILSKSVLDLCYQNSRYAEDKLAFVLAHEIAHLLDDDFWHINFFNAIEISKNKGVSNESVLNQIKGIIGEADKVAAKELRADEKGVLFASMAGFDVNAVIGKKPSENFFKEWEKLLDVQRVAPESYNGDTHPTTDQRTAGVLARLQQVSDQAELFRLGLLFYQSGNFKRAIDAFSEFLRHYPGREVHHNLAVSYHQLALTYTTTSADKQSELPFKMSLTIDPITRASGSVFRGPKENQRRFTENITTAIEYYEAAIKQDPGYLLAYKNLASAYVSNNEPFKAIAILKDALKQTPNDAVLLNVMGVAFYNAENVDKAVEYLSASHKYDPDYADPLFNMGKVEYSRNNKSLAKDYWRQYIHKDPDSNWVKLLNTKYQLGEGGVEEPRGLVAKHNEMLGGIQVGNYTDEVPDEWGQPSQTQYPFKDTQHATLRFNNGVTTVTEGEEIRVLLADTGYGGKTKNGVKIGDAQNTVIKAYGMPSMNLTTTQGNSMVYYDEGITFQLRDGKVVSWVVY